MKRIVTIIFITLSLLLILDSMNFGHALAMFYVAGVIPGTGLAIDAGVMLALFAGTAGFLFARVTHRWVRYSLPKVVTPVE